MTAWRCTVLASALVAGASPALAQHADEHGAGPHTGDHGAPRLPPITDEDRLAAFPDLSGHALHDRDIRAYVQFDRLEWQDAGNGDTAAWDASAWIGRDLDRLWLRSDGEYTDGEFGDADLEAFWGHAFARWWDVLVGVRQDFEPDPARTWAAIGVQGIAPQWFEVEATVYAGESGRLAAQLEIEYELLLTNRLILQPRLAATAYSEDDRVRGIGSGLSGIETGVRLRYEYRREVAPYVGVEWRRALGDTADFAREDGEDIEDLRVVAGIRIWF